MTKRKEKIFLFLSDLIFISLAWTVYYYIRVDTGWINYTNPPAFIAPLIAIYFYWLIIFSFAGLYQHWFVRSRFDEFSSVFKTVSVGCFILFFLIYLDDMMNDAPIISRFLILIYWILTVVFISTGRIIIRSIQRNLLENGIGLRETLIVGRGEKASELKNMIIRYPQLGYRFAGYISIEDPDTGNENSGIAGLNEIKNIIAEKEISEILIALELNEKDKLIDVIRYCSEEKVNLKILPDMYEIVSGMARTNQIYGVPLIEVMPDIMSPAGLLTKRIIDVIISGITLIFLSPLLLIVGIFVKLTSDGPVFYKQERVGKKGLIFVMYKFRSMVVNSEEYGPEWAGDNDPRITNFGKLLRNYI